MATRRATSLVNISRAGLTLAAALGLTRVFAGGAWFVAIAAGALLPAAVFTWSERRRWHGVATLALLAAVGFILAVLVDDPSETVLGLPSGAAISQLGHDLGRAPHVLRSATVPVHPGEAALVLAVLATYLAAAAT